MAGGWRHHEDAGLLVGSIGRALIGSLTRVQDIDLAASVTVALDAETGAVAWRDVGSIPNCFDTIVLPGESRDGDVAVRCRYLGHLSIGAISDPAYADLDVVVDEGAYVHATDQALVGYPTDSR